MRRKSTEHGFSMSHNHCRSKLKSKKNVKWYNCDEKGHAKKKCQKIKKSRYGKAPKLLNTQVCVVSLSGDSEIFYNEVTTIEESRKWLVEV